MNTYILTINHPLPFLPSNRQAIYIEGEYDKEINEYIFNNHDRIQKEFGKEGFQFCYFPMYAERRMKELGQYINPASGNTPMAEFFTRDFVTALFAGNVPQNLKPCVIIYLKYSSTLTCSRFLVIDFVTEKQLCEQRIWWKKLLRTRVLPSGFKTVTELMVTRFIYDLMGTSEMPLYRKDDIDEVECNKTLESHNDIFSEIDEQIKQLQEQGVDALILKHILNQMVDKNRTLSRVVITKDLRILLPDYRDMEIKMEPVNKALFLLYLRHDEGIKIKELVDYRSELESFYTKLSHDDREKRRKTLDALLDPTKNSIHEKISRIKESFVIRFAEDLAEYYFVTGARGDVKRILLDRSMVTWE